MVRGNSPFPWPAIRAWVEDEFDLSDPMALVAILVVLIVLAALQAQPGAVARQAPPAIIIIATPSAAAPAQGAQGLVRKLPAPLIVPALAPPTPAPPTLPPAPDVVEGGAVPAFAAATAAPPPMQPRRVHERPSDKPGPGGGE